MRKFRSCAAAAAAIALSAAAPASEKDQKNSDEDPAAVRCKQISSTGTRARKDEICLTNAQWEAVRQSGKYFIFSHTARDRLPTRTHTAPQ